MRVVAIAKALQRRGHNVQYLAGDALIPILRDFNFEIIEVTDMPQISYPWGKNGEPKALDSETMAKMQEVMMKVAQIEARVVERVRPDVVLSGTGTGAMAAGIIGIPSAMVSLQPHGPKTMAMFSGRMNDRPELLEKMKAMMNAVDIFFLEGMPELSGGVGLESFGEYTVSLKEKLHFTGPLLVDNPDRLPSREELKLRHAGGMTKPVVYFTIGGGSTLIGEDFLAVVLAALRRMSDIVGVVATGIAISPEEIEKRNPPANALIRGFVPGTELIRASDVTVFHGGSSTLMTCIACGTPAVVVPSMGEQEDNGAVLAEQGAGIVLDKATLTAEKLTEAVRQILQNPEYREKAMILKSIGEKYGGAEAAASLVEKLVGGETK